VPLSGATQFTEGAPWPPFSHYHVPTLTTENKPLATSVRLLPLQQLALADHAARRGGGAGGGAGAGAGAGGRVGRHRCVPVACADASVAARQRL
jgi:hypothetical protein